jgi:hypothetical protein
MGRRAPRGAGKGARRPRKTTQKQAEKLGILGHGMHQPFETMFEDVFEEMPWHLKEQCAQMLAEQEAKFGPDWKPE